MKQQTAVTPTFNWVNIFDGGSGRYGGYIWYELPRPMGRGEAQTFCSQNDLCPPERYSAKEPGGINLRRQPTPR